MQEIHLFRFFERGTRWKASILGYEEAMKCFEAFNGEKYAEKYTDDFFEGRYNWEREEEYQRAKEAFLESNRNTRKIPYPMAMG